MARVFSRRRSGLRFGEYDQLHHFIVGGVWDSAPVGDRTACSSGKGSAAATSHRGGDAGIHQPLASTKTKNPFSARGPGINSTPDESQVVGIPECTRSVLAPSFEASADTTQRRRSEREERVREFEFLWPACKNSIEPPVETVEDLDENAFSPCDLCVVCCLSRDRCISRHCVGNAEAAVSTHLPRRLSTAASSVRTTVLRDSGLSDLRHSPGVMVPGTYLLATAEVWMRQLRTDPRGRLPSLRRRRQPQRPSPTQQFAALR